MRGAWGKPYGTVARVDIGQIILSIRCKDSNAHVIQEALRRARYKFPGRQKIIVSKKWGFTNVAREEYQRLKEDKRVLQYVLFPSCWLGCLHWRPGMVPMCSLFVLGDHWRQTCVLNLRREVIFGCIQLCFDVVVHCSLNYIHCISHEGELIASD